MTDHPPDQDPTTIRAQIAAVTIQVTCECGEQLCHEIECEEDDFGGWSAAPEVRHRRTRHERPVPPPRD